MQRHESNAHSNFEPGLVAALSRHGGDKTITPAPRAWLIVDYPPVRSLSETLFCIFWQLQRRGNKVLQSHLPNEHRVWFFLREWNIIVRSFFTSWLPVVAWMLIMFAGSTDILSAEHTSRFLIPFLRWLDPTISSHTILAIHFALRKIGHFTEYAILATLLWRALRVTFGALSRLGISAMTFAIAAVFAASDEYHQSFMPTRTSSARDALIDCFGALVAIVICAAISRIRQASEATLKMEGRAPESPRQAPK